MSTPGGVVPQTSRTLVHRDGGRYARSIASAYLIRGKERSTSSAPKTPPGPPMCPWKGGLSGQDQHFQESLSGSRDKINASLDIAAWWKWHPAGVPKVLAGLGDVSLHIPPKTKAADQEMRRGGRGETREHDTGACLPPPSSDQPTESGVHSRTFLREEAFHPEPQNVCKQRFFWDIP